MFVLAIILVLLDSVGSSKDLLPTIFKYIYANEAICGNLFADDPWIPARNKCQIECDLTEYICQVSQGTAFKNQRCRRLPERCSNGLKKLLSSDLLEAKPTAIFPTTVQKSYTIWMANKTLPYSAQDLNSNDGPKPNLFEIMRKRGSIHGFNLSTISQVKNTEDIKPPSVMPSFDFKRPIDSAQSNQVEKFDHKKPDDSVNPPGIMPPNSELLKFTRSFLETFLTKSKSLHSGEEKSALLTDMVNTQKEYKVFPPSLSPKPPGVQHNDQKEAPPLATTPSPSTISATIIPPPSSTTSSTTTRKATVKLMPFSTTTKSTSRKKNDSTNFLENFGQRIDEAILIPPPRLSGFHSKKDLEASKNNKIAILKPIKSIKNNTKKLSVKKIKKTSPTATTSKPYWSWESVAHRLKKKPFYASNEPQNSQDYSEHCCEWALMGLCDRSWQRVRQLCPRSCGQLVCVDVDGALSCSRAIDVDVFACYKRKNRSFASPNYVPQENNEMKRKYGKDPNEISVIDPLKRAYAIEQEIQRLPIEERRREF